MPTKNKPTRCVRCNSRAELTDWCPLCCNCWSDFSWESYKYNVLRTEYKLYIELVKSGMKELADKVLEDWWINANRK